MGTGVEIEFGQELPQAVARELAGTSGIKVRLGSTESRVHTATGQWHLRIFPHRSLIEDPKDEAQLIHEIVKRENAQDIPLVAAPTIAAALRRALEQRDISYADAHGNLHLVAPGVFIHIELVDRKPRSANTLSSLGAVGIRAIQVLLREPHREWKVLDLCDVAGISLGQAHKLFALLEREGHLVSRGEGPQRRRIIRQPAGLLDWLAAQPSATRVHHRLLCTMYARSLPDLAVKATERLDAANVVHAWTGAAGAALLEAGPTAVPRAMLRVDPDVPLKEAARALEAQPTERGANLVLVEDTGRVGTLDVMPQRTSRVAPAIRVYLDMLGESRGRDAAAHFREVVLGY